MQRGDALHAQGRSVSKWIAADSLVERVSPVTQDSLFSCQHSDWNSFKTTTVMEGNRLSG